MDKFEEIYLISSLISNSKLDSSVDLENDRIWKTLFLNDNTKFSEDILYELNKKGAIDYGEIGEDGFRPIRICSIRANTIEYQKTLINEVSDTLNKKNCEIAHLNIRITDILTFNPQKLSSEIKSTKAVINATKMQIEANPILNSLSKPLSEIESHFLSLSKVANNYEEVYKNIILPLKEEGKSGIRQTVKWAIIGIVASTILSAFISWLTK